MKLNELFADDTAVSPIIGVVLLMTMAVLLAAVIGTVVFGLGASLSPTNSPSGTPPAAPQASFSFDYDDSSTTVTIVHDGGDELDGDEIVLRSDAATIDGLGDDWTAGNEEDISVTGSGDTVYVVWEDSDNAQTSVLAKYDVE